MRTEAEIQGFINHYKNLAALLPEDSRGRAVYEASWSVLSWVLGDTHLVAGYMVGDPDPTVGVVDTLYELCPSMCEGYGCTWNEGHTGQHVAGTGSKVVAVWDQDAPVPRRRVWEDAPVPEYKIGDPDPTPDGWDDQCPAIDQDGNFCTWEYSHTGQHVSGDGEIVVAVWDQ